MGTSPDMIHAEVEGQRELYEHSSTEHTDKPYAPTHSEHVSINPCYPRNPCSKKTNKFTCS